jgi:hypothetical protein
MGRCLVKKQKRKISKDKGEWEKQEWDSILSHKMERKQVSPIIVSHSSLSCFLKASRHRIICYHFHVSLETKLFWMFLRSEKSCKLFLAVFFFRWCKLLRRAFYVNIVYPNGNQRQTGIIWHVYMNSALTISIHAQFIPA